MCLIPDETVLRDGDGNEVSIDPIAVADARRTDICRPTISLRLYPEVQQTDPVFGGILVLQVLLLKRLYC